MTAPDFLSILTAYHATVSGLGALAAVMVMQVVGQNWTLAARNRVLQWAQRFGLLLLSIALMCAAVRVPFHAQSGDYVVLLSTAAINTFILWIMVSTALMGRLNHPQ